MLIKIDYFSVNRILSRMNDVVKEVSLEIENMEEILDDLGIFWDSEASIEFALRVNADLYTANAMLEKIKACINELVEISERFDLTEREIRCLISEMGC